MKFLMCAFGAGVALTGVAAAAPDAAKIDPTYLPYEKPGILVKIPSGQTIHIKCMGTGSPTVILTAGLGDWLATWHEVQPKIAKTTRVCAWDRPGFGFSSGTTRPQTVVNTTADLEAALKVARVAGPYVAVGHSLGGYESLLFKDQNPKAVVGMVLVDPSVPNQMNRMREAAPAAGDAFPAFMKSRSQLFVRCLAGLKSGKVRIGAPDPDGCLAFPSDYPPRLAKALATRDTNPLRFEANQSLGDNFERDAGLVVNPKRNYGGMPLIVLTAMKAQELPPGMPQAAIDQMPQWMKEFARAHDDLAALSSRGINRPVAGSTHYIQYDQPQAVIDAVNEVVAAVRQR